MQPYGVHTCSSISVSRTTLRFKQVVMIITKETFISLTSVTKPMCASLALSNEDRFAKDMLSLR